jgi:hypothetical protein
MCVLGCPEALTKQVRVGAQDAEAEGLLWNALPLTDQLRNRLAQFFWHPGDKSAEIRNPEVGLVRARSAVSE